MSIILNIETATQVCSVGLSRGGEMLAIRESHEKNIHATVVSIFSEEVCKEAGIQIHELDAIAVSKGPGSYTGLRIGVSTAKGFCYALDIPLISVPTLQSMALGIMKSCKENLPDNALFCPMIDARRMEVYTTLYNIKNIEVRKTEALIVEENSFDQELAGHSIYFFGDGAEKCRELLEPKGMIFLDGMHPSAESMASIATEKYNTKQFEDLAYFEPYYLKDFIAGPPKVKGLL